LPSERERCIDAGHDRIEQHPGVVIVDALKRGLQLRAKAFDLTQQPEGIELIARHAGKVIEDDVRRLQVRKLSEHPLQSRPVSVRSGLARLDILTDDARTKTFRVAFACLALPFYRVALLAAPGQLPRTRTRR
jgi:hypothetical protein